MNLTDEERTAIVEAITALKDFQIVNSSPFYSEIREANKRIESHYGFGAYAREVRDKLEALLE